MGKAVAADSISGRYMEGLGLACLTSSTDLMCMIESQQWVGSDMIYESDGECLWNTCSTYSRFLMGNISSGSLSASQPLTQLYENSTVSRALSSYSLKQ